MLTKFEKIERELFSIGNSFKLLNTVIVGKKNKDNVKLDPIYERSYNSSKYSNIEEVSVLNISTSEYLVFSFKEKVDNEFLNSEIYVSYPHIQSLKDFFIQAANDIIGNEEKFYTVRELTPEGENYVTESPKFSGMNNTGTIAICPAKVERRSGDDETVLVNGVAIFIGDQRYCAWTDLNTFATLASIIDSEISLMRESGLTLVMAQNYEILNALKGGNSSSYSSTSGSSMNRRPVTGAKNIFGNKSSNIRNTTSRGITRPSTHTNIDEVIDDDNEEETKPTRTIKKPAGSRKVTKSQLDNIINEDDTSSEPIEDNVPTRTIGKKNKKDDDPVISLEDAIAMSEDDVDISDLNLDEE